MLRSRVRRAARILTPVLAVSFALGAGTAAQAAPATRPSAAPQAAGVTFVIPAGVTAGSVSVGGTHAFVRKTAAEANTAISCTVTPSAPFEYFGGPYGGGEEGIAHTTCSAVVYEIQTVAALFLNNTSNEVSDGTGTVYEQLSGSADAVYPLESGEYFTAVQGSVTTVYGGGSVTSAVYVSAGVYLP
jgi:hypothetical protein